MQLPATLTLTSARSAAELLEREIHSCAPAAVLEIDASGLQNLDSSALAVLLQARRAAQARGVNLRLLALPPKLRQLASLYGVDGLLGVADSASSRG